MNEPLATMTPATPNPRRRDEGFSITEVLVALVVTVIGTLSMATLIAYGTRLQVTARDVTRAAAAGRQELERLRTAPPLSAKRSIDGSLTADVANHFVTVQSQGATFRVRWQVSAGPAGTREVAMVVLPERDDFPLVTMGGKLWP